MNQPRSVNRVYQGDVYCLLRDEGRYIGVARRGAIPRSISRPWRVHRVDYFSVYPYPADDVKELVALTLRYP
jgi:hypothetical protein